MISSVIKKILIEKSELDRLNQRQLRDHLPELQTIARHLNEIRDIMARIKLTIKKRINMIPGMQIWFEKLNKEIGVFSSVLPAHDA